MAHFHIISLKYAFVSIHLHASVKKGHVVCTPHMDEYNLKTYSVTMEKEKEISL